MNSLDHIEAIIIHADWTPAGMSPPLDIPSVHIDENGWPRSGYASHILHDGTVVDLTLARDVAYTSEELQAMTWAERAAISPRYHTIGWNEKSLGICLAGGQVKAPESAGYTWGDNYSIAQCNVLGDELVRIWGEIGRRTDVFFHREAQADRQCPGVMPAWLLASEWAPVLKAVDIWEALEAVDLFCNTDITSGEPPPVDPDIGKKMSRYEFRVLARLDRQIELLEAIERSQRK